MFHEPACASAELEVEKSGFSVHTIEILGATLEEACLKKGVFFSADLHPIL
jgi:hypothetical protein